MPSNPADQRERLFTRYSKQFELYEGHSGIFVCPICRIIFTREALADRPPKVSLAHVVPKALGGKSYTLTCTPCNNGSGSGKESDLAARLQYEDWRKGVGTRPARISGEFGNVGVELGLSADSSKISFHVIEEQSNKENVASLKNLCERYAEDPNAEFTWQTTYSAPHRPGPVLAAVYQSAYLLMFKYFGYEFAFRDEYEPIRQQVLRPEEQIWPGRVNVLSPADFPETSGGRDTAVVFMQKPTPAIFALLRYRTKGGDQVRGVLLPPPGQAKVPQLERGEFEGAVIPYRDEVITRSKGHFPKLWRWVQRKSEEGCFRTRDAD